MPERLEPVRDYPSLVILKQKSQKKLRRSYLVGRSPLINRLESFLPELASANEKLCHNEGKRQVLKDDILVRQEQDESNVNDNDDSDGDENDEDEMKRSEEKEKRTVEMNLYVDNSLGELVGGGVGDNVGSEDGPRKKVIEEVVKETLKEKS